MNTIAAERNLILKHESGAQDAVVVRFFVPNKIREEEWHCRYEILGGPIKHAHHTVGIDSVQALSLALGGIRAELGFFERKHTATFYFLEEPGHEFS